MDRNIELAAGKNIYLASDFHLKTGALKRDFGREKIILKWLEKISQDAQEIVLLGDIFDFWFEYRQVIPKGCIRLQGKLAELSDNGIPISIFTGNHDMWMFGYFEEEMNIKVYHLPQTWQINEMRIHLGHGDGLGPGDRSYKFLKKIFRSKSCQWLFSKLHPTLGMGIANHWSKHSRIQSSKTDEPFLGENEWLLQYCKAVEAKKHHDYYIFGHRHLPLQLAVSEDSQYINLGEWMHHCTYGKVMSHGVELEKWLNHK